MARETILVTGGLGYIGLNMCNELLNMGKKVIIVDNLSNSSIMNLKHLNGDFLFYEVDICNFDELCEIFKLHPIHCVIHFASLKSVSESMEKSLLYYENNVNGTIQLLKAMKKFGCKKIIFSSTACVYTSESPYNETDDIIVDRIENCYGRTKFMIENILKDVSISDQFECVILRYFNPIANVIRNTCFSKNISNLMDVIIDSIRNNKRFFIFGKDYDTKDGTCIRDFIHMYDLIRGHVKALESLNSNNIKNYEVFNLGSGVGISILELVETFEKTNNIKLNYEFGENRPGDKSSYFANIEKAKRILDWTPVKTLEEMCKDSFKTF
jgi:UDP-glucose 4-epimerase